MSDRLPRLAAVSTALVLGFGLVASQVVGGSEPDLRLGTNGRPAEVDGLDREPVPFRPGEPSPDATSTSTTGQRRDQVTTSKNQDEPAPSTSTTRSLDPAPSTTVPAAGNIRGRIVYEEGSQVWSMRADGTDATLLPQDCPFLMNTLDLSPDGTEILRQCMVGGTTLRFEIHAIRVDGNGARLVAQIPGTMPLEPPRFSPDGQRIALSLARGGPAGAPAGDLLVMTRDGDGFHAIDLPGDGLLIDLSWSSDGSWLVFHRDGAIEAVNVHTEELRTVVPAEGATGQLRYPLWSPANDAIVYSEHDGSSFAIRRIDLRSAQTTTLVTEGGDWGEPVWSPDGRSLLYKGVGGLWSVGVDGSDPHLVVAGFQGRFLRAAR